VGRGEAAKGGGQKAECLNLKKNKHMLSERNGGIMVQEGRLGGIAHPTVIVMTTTSEQPGEEMNPESHSGSTRKRDITEGGLGRTLKKWKANN